MINSLSRKGSQEFIQRIEKLTPQTSPQWGKMNVAQMLAHCSVAYEMVYDQVKFPPISGFKRFLLKALVKKAVVGPKPYTKNGRTAPEFIIADTRNFETEKAKLVNFIVKTAELGEAHFDGKENRSFGKLSKQEWNTLFTKHLDHHLTQFGV